MEKRPMSHFTKGLIISLILIVLSIISYILEQDQASWRTWAMNIILLGGIIWACITYGRQKDHNVTFGEVFGHGFKVTGIITLITILFTIIFVLVFPEIKEKSIDMARQEMEKNPQVTDAQLEQALDLTRRMFYIFLIGGIVFLYLVIGAIASLIGAAVTKKNPVSPFEKTYNQP
jgi:hypothetical protein